jgi:type I restriction enzyme S subunit
MQRQIQALCTFDGIPALNAGNLKELQIPIPPLAEQARIAAILDKFDTLTRSISEGLPREIELRQKQYAHYRDLLLSFPKPEVAA